MKRRRKTTRRGKGEGGVNFNEAKGLWVGSISTGLDANGKTVRRYVYAKRKEDLLDKLDLLKSQRKDRSLVAPSRMKVSEYFQTWLEGTARLRVRFGTYQNYSGLIKNKIVPKLGGLKLSLLSAVHIQSLLADLERHGESAYRRQQIHSVLYSALGDAVRLRLIPYNVCASVRSARLPDKEKPVLDELQASKLLEKAKADRLFALYFIALATGMRQGELFGLKWSDIDFKAGTISIQRTTAPEQVEAANGIPKVRIGTNAPKTRKGRRLITLPASAIQILREHKKRMLKEGHLEWVFCNEHGGLLDRNHVRRRKWRPLLEETNTALPNDHKLPTRFRFHDLRHTAATWRLSQSDSLKVIQELLGHAKITTTSDTYSHVTPSMQAQSAERINKKLARLVR